MDINFIYWIGIPLLIGLVWWLIELRARRERKHYAFPPRARAIHDAVQAGHDLRVEYWSREQGKFASNDVTPVGITGFYFNARDKQTGDAVAYKITRIKDLLPLQNGVLVDSEAMPVEEARKQRRHHRRSSGSVYLFVAILVVVVAVMVLAWREKQAARAFDPQSAHEDEEQVIGP